MQSQKTSVLYGGNASYVEELYELFLADSLAVSEQWRSYFESLRLPLEDGELHIDDIAHAPIVEQFVQLARRTGQQSLPATTADPQVARRQLAAQSLIAAFRMVGARRADLDPLRWAPSPPMPQLSPVFHGLESGDLAKKIELPGQHFWKGDASVADLVSALEATYCGTLGTEFMYLSDASERDWWQQRLESTRAKPTLDPEKKLRILERLSAAEGFEKYLHIRYTGQKRFSLEGGESLIVLLDELISHGAKNGVRHVVMGMAHRGRLNVLVNTVGKPPAYLFDEFENKAVNVLPAGDVKYHKGFTGNIDTPDGAVKVVLAFNPSHLEIVNPVVQGMARAQSEQYELSERGAVLPVEIHGDAAISGQGVVMETLSLSYTKGYGTGGTVHIVVNNQIGFTTSDPQETRSSFFCTDIAKMIEAPVLHVNGDDPEAVVHAVQLALDYRKAFGKSVVIDLVCFRRHGHQEQDTPNITQPLMYRSIGAHPGIRQLYANKLVVSGLLTDEDVSSVAQTYRDHLENAQSDALDDSSETGSLAVDTAHPHSQDTGFYSAPTLEQIKALAARVSQLPADLKLHPLVAKVIKGRQEMATAAKPLDWGMGEHLAFASVLATGVDVRLSGEDSERGTFSHRHAVLNPQNREVRGQGKYRPLDHVAPGQQGKFTVINSVLSEAAVLAFEYGYTIARPDAFVLWEAQFGDFANGAQVVTDQFIAAGAAKWGQHSALTLLLPHGQEGTGPEHASARLERYLQLCAQDNMRVCQPTTPVQFFHLLRRQALHAAPRPLIVMTPKSLLRHPEAVNELEEFTTGSFQEVMGERFTTTEQDEKVTRVIVCSGKIYYELQAHRRAVNAEHIALVRLEQLFPFPYEAVAEEFARYKNLESVVWCQEEARNQGAWKFVDDYLRDITPEAVSLRYAGPPPGASTAPGTMSMHVEQQNLVLQSAFA
ncbi:2-oxoglutarate dehydrogenase E1 component [Pseudomonas sp. fls2-241-R2A-110]|uniref:2-oxoglutarate dehydrogenase E1 component n=1 Tax=Pseudomonas sp. fls2-241-R2A-110 TaxID=3040311 RepID=UPI0025548883|nr:2-oxoglutarate dehydrogenase E1 component [Pseudomonas sp. fls2-241-R2A-110]